MIETTGGSIEQMALSRLESLGFEVRMARTSPLKDRIPSATPRPTMAMWCQGDEMYHPPSLFR